MTRLALMLLPLIAACAEEEFTLDPEAYYWDVELLGTHSTCHDEDNAVGYDVSFTYGLHFAGSAATLKIEGNTFASGLLTGCDLAYSSGVYGQDRDQGFVQWELIGEAVIDYGDDACGLADDTNGAPLDWVGVETFHIVYSEDPAIEEGCLYELSVAGTVHEGG
jgi:hypothetical protein